MVDDLKMELHTANQAKEDLAKQVKQAQVLLLSPPAGLVRVWEGPVDKNLQLYVERKRQKYLAQDLFCGT